MAWCGGSGTSELQELLGHSSITVTMDTYGHLFEGAKRKAVDKLEAWIEKEKTDGIERGLHHFKRLLVRYDRHAEIHHAFLAIGCCLVCWRRLANSF